MERTILLADMNSFFASVHQAVDPALRGKPVIVAGDPEKRHGIVLAASYEAKHRGIKTGMAVWEARRACPNGIFISPQYPLYVDFSTRILEIMRDFTPLVEPFSIDEAFLDISGSLKLFGPPLEIARKLKRRIREEVGVTCSVRIGPNKLLAKMAAGLQKPDGLVVLRKEDIPLLIWPLPVRELFGVGTAYEKHLKKLNIHTIGDLAKYPPDLLRRKFGIYGAVLWHFANGMDSSRVDPESLNSFKSMGQQITLPRDYRGSEIKTVILELSDLVAYRVRTGGYKGKTVVLTLRDTRLDWLSRRYTLPEYTDLASDISRAALHLLDRHWLPGKPIRLVGVTLTQLIPNRLEQMNLFGEKEKHKRVETACDYIRDRYGKGAILRAVSLINGRLEFVRS